MTNGHEDPDEERVAAEKRDVARRHGRTTLRLGNKQFNLAAGDDYQVIVNLHSDERVTVIALWRYGELLGEYRDAWPKEWWPWNPSWPKI